MVQWCSSQVEGIQYLKDDKCCMFVEDKLRLWQMVKKDPELEVNRDSFQECLIVMPMSKVTMSQVHLAPELEDKIPQELDELVC
jgi:hypothetical protein